MTPKCKRWYIRKTRKREKKSRVARLVISRFIVSLVGSRVWRDLSRVKQFDECGRVTLHLRILNLLEG